MSAAKIVVNGKAVELGGSASAAEQVSFDNEETGMKSKNVQGAIEELFTSVSEGKALIADAVTDKGIETSASDSFSQMAENIGKIKSGGLPEDLFKISLEAYPPELGTVAGGGYAEKDMTVTVEAIKAAGAEYGFLGWEEDGEVVNTSQTYSFPVNKDRSLVANFIYHQYVAGRDWFRTSLPIAADWTEMVYGDGKFVVVSGWISASTASAYSEDGINWTTTTMPSNRYWCAVTYGGGKFVAVCGGIMGNSDIAAYSTNGKNWVTMNMPNAAWSGVTYGDGKFVAVSRNSVGAYSEDGINWVQTAMPSGTWKSVAYGNGVFVALDNTTNSNLAARSTDGKTWKTVTLPEVNSASGAYFSVRFCRDRFMAARQNNDTLVYSADGLTWNQAKLPKTGAWIEFSYGDGKFVLNGNNTDVTLYSEDGINWIESKLPVSDSWLGLAYGNGVFAAIARTKNIAAYSFTGNEAPVQTQAAPSIRLDEPIDFTTSMTASDFY